MNLAEIKKAMQVIIDMMRETEKLVAEDPSVRNYVEQQQGIVAICLSLMNNGLQQLMCRGIGDYANALKRIDQLALEAGTLMETADAMRACAITERTRAWMKEAGA